MSQTVWQQRRMRWTGMGRGPTTRGPDVTAADRWAALLVGLAGVLHLLLLPQHWAESPLFGLVFAAIALGQLGVAAALWTVAGPRVRQTGRWAALGVVALYLGARVVTPPGASSPEGVDAWGLASLVLELGALGALTVGLPLGEGRSARGRFPRLLAASVGITFLLTDLVAGGDLLFSSEPFAPFAPAWGLTIYATPPFGPLVPALQVSLADHWSFYLPWASTALAALVALGLALAVGWTVQLARMRPTCPQRFGLLGASPAVLAAPVCCGPSLLSVTGVGALAGTSALAQPLLVLAAVLVAADAAWVRRQLARAQRGVVPSR